MAAVSESRRSVLDTLREDDRVVVEKITDFDRGDVVVFTDPGGWLSGPDSAGPTNPVAQVMDELTEIFADLGFAVAEGPEIEDEWHNFTALNMPESHPARAMHDTFYCEPRDGETELHLLTNVPVKDARLGKSRLSAPTRTLAE